MWVAARWAQGDVGGGRVGVWVGVCARARARARVCVCVRACVCVCVRLARVLAVVSEWVSE